MIEMAIRLEKQYICNYTLYMPAGPDLSECAACLCLASRRGARAMTRFFERQLRPHGIRITQFTALVALSMSGPLSIGALANAIGVERTTLSRNLARLAARGWIEIAGAADDARSRIVTVTPQGRTILADALPAWRKAQSAAQAAIGGAGADALRGLARIRIG
jgi:DNA-binding MarR family transcriptional regulator